MNIIPSQNNKYGNPVLTDYIIIWKNLYDGDKGRLTHGSNYENINIAGSESESNFVYVKPNPNGLDAGIEIIHNKLNSVVKNS